MQLPAQHNQWSYSSAVTGIHGSESGSGSDNDSDAKSSIHDLLKPTK
jgi:hypothetical protein